MQSLPFRVREGSVFLHYDRPILPHYRVETVAVVIVKVDYTFQAVDGYIARM